MELEVLEGFLELNHKAVEDGDLADQVRLNHLFHEALWRAAHNEYLRRHLETLRGLIERGRPTTLQIPGRPEESLQEHTAIVEALTSRDAPAAEVATKLHFRRAMALRLLTQRHLGPTVEDHSGAVAEAEAGRESNETFVRTSNGSGRP
jgi:DNA-binding GntR family transcriptional regulator